MQSFQRSTLSRALFACAWIIAAATGAYAESDRSLPISELGAGPPALSEGPLHPNAYKVNTARELANAEVLWLNFDWLREKGFHIPPQGATPQFLREVLKTLGYKIPAPSDPASAFGRGSIPVYADGYGGDDTTNLGSGRAWSRKMVQEKGGGVTDHVRETNAHKSGGAHLGEGDYEAFYGEITHNELANSSSRTIALIKTGTTVQEVDWSYDGILIVRPDPLRPAQFIRNHKAATPEDIAWDAARVKSVIRNLPGALPQRSGATFANDGERLAAGLKEFNRLMALQFADYYVMRLHHGASSTSNAMLNGGTIDFGTFSALAGWTRVQRSPMGSPFGDPNEVKDWILKPFVDDLRQAVPAEWRKYIPTAQAFAREFDRNYAQLLPERMLKLTGAPPELIEKLKSRAVSRELGDALFRLTQAGNENMIYGWDYMDKDYGKYRVQEVLQKLIGGEPLTHADIADEALRDNLSRAYARFRGPLESAARAEGIAPAALRTYMRETSAAITRKQPETYYVDDFQEAPNKGYQKYLDAGKDRRVFQDYMDQKIERNIRVFRDAAPFETVISQRANPELGITLRKVYNAKAGKYFDVIRVADAGGESNFFGRILPTSELESASVAFLPSRQSSRTPREASPRWSAAERSGKFTEFRVESDESALPLARRGQVQLRTADGAIHTVRKPTTFRRGCSSMLAAIGARSVD